MKRLLRRSSIGITTLFTLALSINSQAAVEIECDRECLAGFMDNYLKALISHDADSLAVTRNIKYTENGLHH